MLKILLPSRERAWASLLILILLLPRERTSCRPWSFLADFEGDRSTRFDFWLRPFGTSVRDVVVASDW